MAHGPLEVPVHGGLQPWPAEGLTGAWPSGRSGARWLTGDGAMERGARGESVSGLTWVRAAVWRSVTTVKKRRWWRSVRGCLGVGRREGERKKVRWRTAGLPPFIGAEGGVAAGG
jgi:hypothetical protein